MAIVHSTAMNIGVREYFQSIGHMTAVGWLNYMETLLLVFSETSILFSTVVTPIYISHQQRARVPLSPHSHQH